MGEMEQLLDGVDALRGVCSRPTHVLHLAMLFNGLNVERAAEALLRGELDGEEEGDRYETEVLGKDQVMMEARGGSVGPRPVSLQQWVASQPRNSRGNAWSDGERSLERVMKVRALGESFPDTKDVTIIESVLEASGWDSDLAYAQMLEMAGDARGMEAARTSSPAHSRRSPPETESPSTSHRPGFPSVADTAGKTPLPAKREGEWTVVGAHKREMGTSRRERRRRGIGIAGVADMTKESFFVSGGEAQNSYLHADAGAEQLRRLAAGYRLLQRTSLRSLTMAARGGDHSAAARARADSNAYGRLAERADAMASARHLRRHADGRRALVLDLHGQHVSEAIGLVERAIAQCRARASEMQRECTLGLICGQGKHSQGGRQVLMPAIRDHVRSALRLPCVEADPGVLDVTIRYQQ